MHGIGVVLLAMLALVHIQRTCPKVECKYGTELGICNCCPSCYKGPNEVCGGIWNLGGTCARSLYCTNPPETLDLSNQAPGVCKRSHVKYLPTIGKDHK
ncbi:crustacean hematopoietic factor-like [Homarus americanus]|uniref:Crustacean hematopoietic factor-like n=1 Tax=Homarus americanus TaxID=6706 RepID=A0A8J5MUR6_HOMAM|nr:crustacean hematopoietic factor-like [Homarus americanus]